jgi:ParB family chromosome partitioning protein
MSKKRGLGKGLGALLENANTDITQSSDGNQVAGSVALIKIDQIETNPFQPRTDFEKEALIELSESIKEHGIIQPITVRKMGNDNFQLISGERRFRASQLAGLKEIPAYIRVANDQAMLEMAIVENIQRENLNVVEVALSYQRLIEECNLTQAELGEKVAKSRSNITNHLRILKLPADIQLGLRELAITMGHARALLSIDDNKYRSQVYRKILDENLSVRQVEEIAKNFAGKEVTSPSTSKKGVLTDQQKEFIELFSNSISTRIDISKDEKGKGKININFNSDTDLNRIIELLQS